MNYVIQNVEYLIIDHSLSEDDQNLPFIDLRIELFLQEKKYVEHISRRIQTDELLVHRDTIPLDVLQKVVLKNPRQHKLPFPLNKLHGLLITMKMLKHIG